MFNHTIYLPDGDKVDVFSNDDFRKLIKSRLGEDAEAWVIELIDGYENYIAIEEAT